MKRIVSIIFIVFPLYLLAQETKPGIHFNGFVKTDIFYDSRQVESFREGHFLLFPLGISKDKNDKDANAQPSFNILSIQTRLTGNITAPDALGAKTSGLMEAEFFGTSNNDVNGFRLRHAYVKLNWKTTELLVGQTWHPMFVANCFPEVISFNTGAPFQPFSRNPQIRVTQNIKGFHIQGAVLSQRDFVSNGPEGLSSKYLRNASVPDMQLQLFYRKQNEEKQSDFLIGAGGGYKLLKPRLMTDKSYKTDKKVQGYSGEFYTKVKFRSFTFKLAGIYGQNMHDLTMLGGYAFRYENDSAEMAQNDLNYTTLDILSGWAEFMVTVKNWQFGLFGGYTKNLGSLKNIYNWDKTSSYFTRGRDIADIYRISPRVVFNAGKLRLALEGEYTSAAYGSDINSLGVPLDLKRVANTRVLLGVYYFF